MSGPPSNPPSGFPMPGDPPPVSHDYGQPPPGRAGENSGCLKAFGITCLTLLVLSIVVVLAVFPTLHGAFQTAEGTAQARMDGESIRQAILTYHKKNGTYPPTLISLVTDGESDGRDFHSDLDADPDPAHVSWNYTPAAEGAPGDTPILDLPYHLTFLGHPIPGRVEVDLNGSSKSS